MHMSVSFPNSLCKQQDEEQYVPAKRKTWNFHVNEHPPKAALNGNLKLAPNADKPIELSNPSSTADVFTDKSVLYHNHSHLADAQNYEAASKESRKTTLRMFIQLYIFFINFISDKQITDMTQTLFAKQLNTLAL